LAAARRRYEKLLESLSAAEHDVDEADADLIAADQSVRGAAERLDKAKVELAQAESALGAVNGNDPPTGDR
jgi:chromosome segregation ATPase